MIVRCVGCGIIVSEWAARCARCGRPVEESLAAAAPTPEVATGPRVVEGLVLGDVPVDPASAVWSPDPSRLVYLEPPAPADAEEPADFGTDPTAGPDVAVRRRRWVWGIAGGATALALVGVGVLLRHEGGTGASSPGPGAIRPPTSQPVARWTKPLPFGEDLRLPQFVRTAGVIVAAQPGKVTAYEETSGEVRWRYELDTEGTTANVSAAGDLVLLASRSVVSAVPSDLVALDAETGTERWRAAGAGFLVGVNGGSATTLAFDDNEGTRCAVVDLETGETDAIEGEIVGVVDDAIAVAVDGSVSLYPIGQSEAVGTWAVDDGQGIGSVARFGDLLVVSSRGTLSAYDHSGPRWSVHVDADVGLAGSAAGGRLLTVAIDDTGEQHLALRDISGDAPVTLWTADAGLDTVVSTSLAVVTRQDEMQLVDVGTDGLTTLATLGPVDAAELLGAGRGRVIVSDDQGVIAFTFGGKTSWTVDTDQDAQAVVVDDGLVVVSDNQLTFYS